MRVIAGMGRILVENPKIAVIAEFAPSHLARAGVGLKQWFGAFKAAGLRAFEIDEVDGAVRPVRLSRIRNALSTNVLFTRDLPTELDRAAS